MLKNNKGFTMVELVVSIAVLSLLSIGVTSLMTTGARNYSTVNTLVNLQYESQMALAQVQEYAIDCNYAINWNDTDNTLTIVNKGDADFDFVYHVFRLDNTDNTLYYGTQVYSHIEHSDTPMEVRQGVVDATPAGIANAVVARDVQSFDIVLPSALSITDEDFDGDGDINEATDAYAVIDELSYTLILENYGRTHTATQRISLRNKPMVI